MWLVLLLSCPRSPLTQTYTSRASSAVLLRQGAGNHSAECCSWWEAGPLALVTSGSAFPPATAGEEWEVGFFPLSMPPHGRWGAGPDPDIFCSYSLGGSPVPHQQGQLDYAVQVRCRACAQSWRCWAHSCCLLPAQNREPWAGGVCLLLLLSLNVMNIFY